MRYHRRLLLRIVVALTLRVKIRAIRKEREPDHATDPAPLLARILARPGSPDPIALPSYRAYGGDTGSRQTVPSYCGASWPFFS